MDIYKCLKEECIGLRVDATGRDDVLRRIAKLAEKSPTLPDTVNSERIFKALLAREEIGSTGFEDGIAIPHCRLPEVENFTVGVVTIDGGVDFGAIDGEKSEIFFFIVGPEDRRDEHIRLLSGISRTLSLPGVKKEILQSANPEDFRDHFLRHLAGKAHGGEEEKFCAFTIHIQVEEKFMEVLQAAETVGASVAVIEAADPGRYLNSLPLFSTFWNSEDKGFHRIITGTVKCSLSNELVRSVSIAGEGLEDCSGIMISVFDNVFVFGSLHS
jgi:nitrogen PTS system EIIA component